jgi:hypothetical protein
VAELCRGRRSGAAGRLRRRLAAGALLADRSPSEITNAQVATVGPALHVMQEDDPDGILAPSPAA